jgi:hypothetical protein
LNTGKTLDKEEVLYYYFFATPTKSITAGNDVKLLKYGGLNVT